MLSIIFNGIAQIWTSLGNIYLINESVWGDVPLQLSARTLIIGVVITSVVFSFLFPWYTSGDDEEED